ncbi:MAG TPA: hypothetical protein PLA71_00870 [Saccharofermentans sp.]|nr:hypothetical protein [Saccharofermentans sp.]
MKFEQLVNAYLLLEDNYNMATGLYGLDNLNSLKNGQLNHTVKSLDKLFYDKEL